MENKEKKFLTHSNKDSVIIDFLLDELQTMTTTMVVKLDYMAKKYETLDTREAGDLYVEATESKDVFESYTKYEPDVIKEIGLAPGTQLATGVIVTQKMFEDYCVKPYTIPYEYKQIALEKQRAYIIKNYKEKNRYYLELNGEPPLDENPKDYVFIKKPIKGVDITKPVHLMNKDELTKLKIDGILDRIITKYKDKRYLKHVLDLKISYAVSRKARNYQILHLTRPLHHEGLSNRFLALYSQSLAYVMETVYDPAYKTKGDYYDGFIGMFILSITIQRFISNYFKSGIKRDFFNKEIIGTYMDSYGIPFYTDISLTYLSRIAKNLNMLLLFKATDQIFVDIFSLFGLKEANIYKYFLLKERKLDTNAEPIFAYKTVTDEEGNTKEVEDLNAMYDLKFVSVPSNTKELSVEILNPANYVDYQLVVEDDYLWGGDGDREDFLNKVLESEFNYVETKYISMTSRYELTQLGFELCYFFKMIYDLKPQEDNLTITMSSGRHKVFNVFTTLFALASMSMNFDGNIMDKPTKTLHVLGFNFKYDIDYLNKIIKDAELENGNELIIERTDTSFSTQTDLLNMYFNNRDIYRHIMKRKKNAKTMKEYNAYKKIYNATLIAEYCNENYKLKNGNVAKTYLEYLEENDVNLYKLVKETTKDNLVENLENILVTLDEYFKSDKFDNIFLNIPNLSLDSVKRFVYYLVDIFKSYTVDLVSMNVLYHMGAQDTEYIKFIDEMYPEGFIEYDEKVDKEADRRFNRPGVWIRDMMGYLTPFHSMYSDYIKFKDKIGDIDVKVTILDYLRLKDIEDISVIIQSLTNKNNSLIESTEKVQISNNSVEHHNVVKFKDFIFIE